LTGARSCGTQACRSQCFWGIFRQISEAAGCGDDGDRRGEGLRGRRRRRRRRRRREGRRRRRRRVRKKEA
jgi:hypothetical protein